MYLIAGYRYTGRDSQTIPFSDGRYRPLSTDRGECRTVESAVDGRPDIGSFTCRAGTCEFRARYRTDRRESRYLSSSDHFAVVRDERSVSGV